MRLSRRCSCVGQHKFPTDSTGKPGSVGWKGLAMWAHGVVGHCETHWLPLLHTPLPPYHQVFVCAIFGRYFLFAGVRICDSVGDMQRQPPLCMTTASPRCLLLWPAASRTTQAPSSLGGWDVAMGCCCRARVKVQSVPKFSLPAGAGRQLHTRSELGGRSIMC